MRIAFGLLFVGAGVLHVVAPGPYLSIMPPYVPAPRAMVALSGAAEIAGGVGLWWPAGRLRRSAGLGLALLLVAVYPANVQMALDGTAGPAWVLWARLPLQGVLVACALRLSGALGTGGPGAGAGRYSNVSNTPGHASRASERSAGA